MFLLTLVVRAALLPSAIKQQKGTASQLRMQAKVNKIREQYKGNQQKINEETQALYQKEGFNPMSSGCLPLLIQMPIIIGLFGVSYTPLSQVLRINADVVAKLKDALVTLPEYLESIGGAENIARNSRQIEIGILKFFDKLVEMVPEVGAYADQIHSFRESFTFFGINLYDKAEFNNFNIIWLIPILSGLTALLLSIYTTLKQRKTNPEMAKNPTAGCMMLMSPAMSVYFAFILPAGVGVYWIMSNIISFVQTLLLNYTHNPKKMMAQVMIDETVQKRSKEENIKKIKAMQDEQE